METSFRDIAQQISSSLSPEKIQHIMNTFSQMLQKPFAERLLHQLKAANHEIPPILLEDFKLQIKSWNDITTHTLKLQYIDEIFNVIHNARFRETQLTDGNPEKDLQLHQLGDGYQARASQWIFNYFPKKILPSLLKQFIKIRYHPSILEMPPEEEQLLKDSIAGIEKGENTLFLLNHDHLGNFLMVLLKMMLVAQQMGKPAINNDIYMVVGALVKTNKIQDMIMNAFAHTIITQPVNNTPPELKEVYAWVRKQTTHKIFNTLSLDENGNPLPQQPQRGKLLFINPYGTREVVTGTAESPLFYLPDASYLSNRTTFPLVKKIKESWRIRIIVIGTNSIDLKRGKNPFNNERKRNANIELHAKDVSSPDEIKNTAEMIEAIRSMILHWSREVAKTIPPDSFEAIKKLQKAGNLQEYCNEQGEICLDRSSA